MLHELLKLTRPLFVIDTETTGTDIQSARIIELGFQEWTAAGMVKEWKSYVNPGIPIPPASIAIHHITDEMVKDAYTFRQLAPSLAKGFVDCDLAGKNVRFDLRIIAAEMARASQPWSYTGARIIDAERLEQLAVPRSLSHLHEKYTGDIGVKFFAVAKDGTRNEITDLYWFEENYVHSLYDISKDGERIEVITFSTGQKHDGAHDALSDVRATSTVIAKQLEAHTSLPRDLDALHDAQWPNLIDAEMKFKYVAGVPTVAFGKWRDKPFHAVEREYWCWISGPKSDFSDEIKAIARDAAQGKFPQEKK